MSIDFRFLDEVARDLPIIRPIKEFIHLNLLLPYQHLPFWEALTQVSSKLEAMPLADMEFFRQKINSGELSEDLIRAKIDLHAPVAKQTEVQEFVFKSPFAFTHHDSRVGRLHEQWNELININVIALADGMLIKWLSMFLDQGIGHWQMPGSDSLSFYECVKSLLKESYFLPDPFEKSDFEKLFLETPEQAIEQHLKFLCPEEDYQKEYCQESILTLRGWAGLIFCLQQNPQLLSFPRRVTLVDFLAVKLIIERAWVNKENDTGKVPKFSKAQYPAPNPFVSDIAGLAFRACQEALEESTYAALLKQISGNTIQERDGIQFQVVFCMDDRESYLRRHLEATSPKVETFGTAGHFGIEMLYQHHEDAFPKKQCPAPLAPKYILKDQAVEKYYAKVKHNLSFEMIQPSSNLATDWIFSYLNAWKSALKLASNLFFPLAFKDLTNVQEKRPDAELKLLRTAPVIEGQLKEGYSEEEMADLIHSQLLLIGFVHRFAPLIFIVGHGANSENNPYFATYGCGACSGRPGSANARAFCQMANNHNVRKLIFEKHGLKIPETTYFVPGFHDTTRDTVEFYETHQVPDELRRSFQKFKNYLKIALYKNARERCQAFKLVTYERISKQAQKEVLRRSYSLFETRPELGHTNVAFAIVSRRKLTYGLDIARPAFMQSYDPTVDPKGALLAATLGAVIPVCSGISLDYFFSRVDNMRFGAGSKLPQNIVGNIGVSHGTESDLLFGLPFQMIDQHSPLRLTVLVEHSPAVALSAIQFNPLVKQIVYNNWIHYGCYDPDTGKYHFFQDGNMVEFRAGEAV